MKYKLVIFDLDGTLLNTLDDLMLSLNYALASSGLPKRTHEEVLHFVGDGIKKLVERGVPKGTSSELFEKTFLEFKDYYRLHCADNTEPYDGIIDLLCALKARGHMIAVVSNKADFACKSLCDKYFAGMFDAIVGENPSIRKKPAPDTVNMVLEQLHIDRNDAVYIGDSEVDIATAKNANMDCISVDWGFRDNDELINSGATKIVSNPNEILNEV